VLRKVKVLYTVRPPLRWLLESNFSCHCTAS